MKNKLKVSLRVINSNSKNKKLYFDIPTRSQKLKIPLQITNFKSKFFLFCFQVIHSKWKNINFHFELLTPWLKF